MLGRLLHPKEHPATYQMPDGSTLARASVDPKEWRGLSDTERATLRWAQINAEKRAAGCPCGRPATEVKCDSRNTGSVPVETWTCAEHKDAAGWSGRPGEMKPMWARSSPCVVCTGHCARAGLINGPTHTWYCPDRTDEDFRCAVVMALCTEDDDEERTDEQVIERIRELVRRDMERG